MRIISGEYRGRHIDPVDGDTTRPTTDRVREAIASSVISYMDDGFEGLNVIDAFAGSGALGFEALSRGASTCLLVDDSQKAISTLNSNARALGVSSSCKIVKGNAFSMAQTDGFKWALKRNFDLVFLDPPYRFGYEEVCELVANMIRNDELSDEALIVYQRANDEPPKRKKASKEKLPKDLDGMLEILGDRVEYVSYRKYGVTQVIYFMYHACDGTAQGE